MRGNNAASLRYKTLKTKSVKVYVQEEQSKDKEVNSPDETVGYLTLWSNEKDAKTTTRGFISTEMLVGNMQVQQDWSAMQTVKRFPLSQPTMYIKTMYWQGNCVSKLNRFQSSIYSKKTLTKGYCERMVNNLDQVSNSKFCAKGATKNVGYYYRIVFPNVYGGAEWCFRTRGNFGNGGVTMLNGKTVSVTKDGKKQMDFCQKLKKGNHVLEVFGASSGKDTKVYKWTFSVDKSTW